jgi:hypothetical protein
MADVKVKLKLREINKLMTSAPVVSMIAQRAKRIAAAAGPGFIASINSHKYTARAYIKTDTTAARKRQAEDAVLERSLSAGG